MGCGFVPYLLLDCRVLSRAESTHEVTRVDKHGARGLAHAIHRTGLHALVLVVFLEFSRESVVTVGVRGRDGTLHHNSLSRGQRQVTARAHRFTVTALDTTVDLGFNRRSGLDVLEVQGGVVGDYDAGVEHPARVKQHFHLTHHAVQFVAILALHVGGHDAPGTVLGLERTALAQHEIHQVFRERCIPFQTGSLEQIGEHEVDVAILCVPKNHTVLVPVLVEELNKSGACAGQ